MKLKTFEYFGINKMYKSLNAYKKWRKLPIEEREKEDNNIKNMLNEIDEIIKKYQLMLNLDEDDVREIIYQDLADKLDSLGL